MGGAGFQDLLQEAIKIRSSTDAKLRTDFNARPKFWQASMFAQPLVVEARQLPLQQRLEAATQLREAGNTLFREGRIEEATMKYEQSLSVFTYLHNRNPEWRKSGIKDEDIHVVDFCASCQEFRQQPPSKAGGADDREGGQAVEGGEASGGVCKGEEQEEEQPQQQQEGQSLAVQHAAVRRHTLSCYLNIALAYHKQRDFGTAIAACTEALKMDGGNAKALYRRALSRMTPKSAGGLELDMAIDDLTRASSLAAAAATAAAAGGGGSKGCSDGTPAGVSSTCDEATRLAVNKLLREYMDQKKAQLKRDKQTFAGMFERGGSIVQEDEEDDVRKGWQGKGKGKGAGKGGREEEGPSRAAGDEASRADYLNYAKELEERAVKCEKDGLDEEGEAFRERASNIRAALQSAAPSDCDSYAPRSGSSHGGSSSISSSGGRRSVQGGGSKQRQQKMTAEEWSNPSPEMVADALKEGIDLTNRDVQEMMAQMQRDADAGLLDEQDLLRQGVGQGEGLTSGGGEEAVAGEGACGRPAAGGGGGPPKLRRQVVEGALRSMPRAELETVLTDMGLPFQPHSKSADMQDQVMAALDSSQGHWKEDAEEEEEEEEHNIRGKRKGARWESPQQPQNWKVAVVVVIATLGYRLYSTGLGAWALRELGLGAGLGIGRGGYEEGWGGGGEGDGVLPYHAGAASSFGSAEGAAGEEFPLD